MVGVSAVGSMRKEIVPGHLVIIDQFIDRTRGRTEESIRRRYRELVEPNYEMHVLPTRAYADMVLSGLDPVDDLVRAVIARIDA